MPTPWPTLRCLLLCLPSLLPVTACADADALWHIVHAQCVPQARQGHTPPTPCRQVDLSRGEAQGSALLKDRNGILQFLLLPTAKISGIESPALLAADTPNYFALAWQARDAMSALRGQPIARDNIALTINSRYGRSQNQLHIHISCVTPTLKAQLAKTPLGTTWQTMPGGVNGRPYWARFVPGDSLAGVDLFKDVAAHLPTAREQMASFTLAVVGARLADGQQGLVLLAHQADLLHADLASAEGDVQDHACQVLSPP